VETDSQKPASKPFYLSKRVFGAVVLVGLVASKVLNWWPDNVWSGRIQELCFLLSAAWEAFWGIRDNTPLRWNLPGFTPPTQPQG
jgi:hypothetical protein